MSETTVWTTPGYATVRELGTGAFGRVVQAQCRTTGRPVAVKYLHEHSLRAEFRAEARLLSALRSSHVVRLVDYVESAHGTAIVMDLAPGRTLKSILADDGPLTPEAALTVFKGSLRGLADAHRAHVVHRDYKPDNVLVSTAGFPTLVDFGIAVRAGTETSSIGTPAYMPPEQWQGLPASAAGDLYAATAVFFECLTGRRPFTARSVLQLAAQHLHAPVPADLVPAPLGDLVLRGLAKHVGDRPVTAANFEAELEFVARRFYGPDWERRGRAYFAEGHQAVLSA
ncbi:MAG: serine/threonine-protein kinase [Streptosporangiaceae bacterium]